MKIIFLIFTIFIQLFATSLLTYNIYDRSDRVDLMLSFDSPYDGQISQERSANLLVLKLSDLSYNNIIKKEISSSIVQSLTIKPNGSFLKIIINSKNQIGVIASKTTDGFGLRIRIKLTTSAGKNKAKSSFTQVTTQKTQYYDGNSLDYRYISVLIILFVLLAIMFWVKRKFTYNNSTKGENSWLFKKGSSSTQDIKIVYKKPIDNNNSAIVLEFENKRYLVISGNSNLLLDIFSENELQNRSEFEKAFEDNRKKLDDYLKLQDKKLEDYKEKASNDFEDMNFYK